ncbi:hypothetical protein BKE38_15900 [Pseudoroseomonas deserti]|uniref:DUF7847 domain-containing protein n=1 Tax=Teichococcus deserti TaxID=1817963 RepID=A0A1V2H279_9PROT|nr:hypothetical protein [Pseudoroseomonas deserti]ONG51571.1 hypothetical protein BKE38_15900 [Pseudoroseomonas deserti]
MSSTLPGSLLPAEKIGLAPIVRMTFGVIGRQPVTFLLLPLLVVSLPTIGAQFLLARTLLLPDVMVESSASMMVIGVVAGAGMGLFGMLLHYLLQAMLTYAAVADFNGRRASLGESLGRGVAALLPALGAAILMLAGIVLGIALLVVPGVMLLCIWAVAVPAVVIERTGVFGGLRRSRELTRGNRWRILGLAIFYVAISLALSGIAVAVAYMLVTTELYWMDTLVQGLTSAVSATIGATGSAALYAELRRIQEGASPETLASIFD